jgi:hypothetical protein
MVAPRYDYTALHDIYVDGVAAARTGDGLTAHVVDNWRDNKGMTLVVGVDIKPTRGDVIPRPASNAPVAEWRTYAIGQGMDPAEAEDAKRAELVERYPAEERDDVMPLRQPDTEADEQVAPPPKSASKGEWVDYVVDQHGVERADAEAMTLKDLQATYGPDAEAER